MNRFDRMLGILLHLRGGQAVSALALARHFEVSRRTIYRDVEALSALGVPVYARRGHEGGFQTPTNALQKAGVQSGTSPSRC
jgi:predicted DNA-binding transcriptional regulator YafY